MKVNGESVDFTIDTGADVTVLTCKTFERLGTRLNQPSKLLLSADGSKLDVVGEANVSIKSKHKSIDTTVSVVKGAKRDLLGVEQVRDLGLLAIVNAVCRKSFEPFVEFAKLFEGLGKMPGVFSISLKRDTEPLRLLAPRPIAAGLREKAKSEIDRMLELKVIEPVEEPTEWCSGLTIAPKPNGAIRMCVDLTVLNKGVKREIYPLPRVSDMLSQLSAGRMFSKLDANSGFWQVELNPECKLLTTFITPWGRFCFRRMPFGISSAPEFFQRSMEKILAGLPGVVCMMDDVLVYGGDADEHWSRLRDVLNRIQNSGMTLRKDKCEFGSHEVKFLGHVISACGIKPDPDKVKAIREMNPPTNKKEARRFIGMVNYLNKFSSKLAELCVPIFSIMGKKSEWLWSDVQQKAFDDIKSVLSEAPVLCAFDPGMKHRVTADASKGALGAVLLQYNCDKEWQPVEYASRKLTEAECRYAMIEKEALAVTWACEKFDYYLVGRQFEVETDHKPLVSLLGEKDLSKLPLRVQRFKMRMLRYSYEIFHTPGVSMFLADMLSRPNGSDDISCAEVVAKCNSVESYVDQCVSGFINNDVRELELYEATNSDAIAQQCLLYLSDSWPVSGRKLCDELNRMFGCRDKLTQYNGLLMYENRMYIPKSLRPVYLKRFHEGHQGINKTCRRAKQYAWWPGISNDIENYINKCDVCVRHSAIKHQPAVDSGLPRAPWVEVGSDVFEFDKMLYVVVIDYYSKWIEVVSLLSQTSEAVVVALKKVFVRFGVPEVMRTDNGPCYNCQLFRKFACEWGFSHTTSSPRYPQSNGLSERAVGIVKRLWRKGDDRLSSLLVYNSTPLVSGYAPADLMFGRSVRTPLGSPKGVVVDYEEYECIENEIREKNRLKWNVKFKAKRLPELIVGQRVWMKAPTEVGREAVVVRKDKHPDSYWVAVDMSEYRRNRKHLFSLDNANGEKVDIEADEYVPLPDTLCIASDLGGDHVDESGGESDAASVISEHESVHVSVDVDEGDTSDESALDNLELHDLFDEPVSPAVAGDDDSGGEIEFQPRVLRECVTRTGRVSKRRSDPGYIYY